MKSEELPTEDKSPREILDYLRVAVIQAEQEGGFTVNRIRVGANLYKTKIRFIEKDINKLGVKVVVSETLEEPSPWLKTLS